MLLSKLHSIAGKDDWDWSTRFEGREIRLGTWLDECKMQERDQTGSHFETTCSAEKSPAAFESDFVTLFVLPTVRIGPVVSYSASSDTTVATLE